MKRGSNTVLFCKLTGKAATLLRIEVIVQKVKKMEVVNRMLVVTCRETIENIIE